MGVLIQNGMEGTPTPEFSVNNIDKLFINVPQTVPETAAFLYTGWKDSIFPLTDVEKTVTTYDLGEEGDNITVLKYRIWESALLSPARTGESGIMPTLYVPGLLEDTGPWGDHIKVASYPLDPVDYRFPESREVTVDEIGFAVSAIRSQRLDTNPVIYSQLRMLSGILCDIVAER